MSLLHRLMMLEEFRVGSRLLEPSLPSKSLFSHEIIDVFPDLKPIFVPFLSRHL